MQRIPLALGMRVWPQAISQFLVGHFDLLNTAKTALTVSLHFCLNIPINKLSPHFLRFVCIKCLLSFPV